MERENVTVVRRSQRKESVSMFLRRELHTRTHTIVSTKYEALATEDRGNPTTQHSAELKFNFRFVIGISV